jgi:hypothetical protein
MEIPDDFIERSHDEPKIEVPDQAFVQVLKLADPDLRKRLLDIIGVIAVGKCDFEKIDKAERIGYALEKVNTYLETPDEATVHALAPDEASPTPARPAMRASAQQTESDPAHSPTAA